MYTVNKKRLTDSNGNEITNLSLSSGVAVYSQSIKIDKNTGFSTLLVTENQAGGTGDVDISAEYSIDGSNWYTPYESDLAGAITAEGNIVTTLQNVTRWIEHEVSMALFMRYKFDPDADSQITADHIYQEQF